MEEFIRGDGKPDTLPMPENSKRSQPILPWLKRFLGLDDRGAKVYPELEAELDARTELGIVRYGQPLHTFDGRPPTIDCTGEHVDALQYMAKARLEEDDDVWQRELEHLIVMQAGVYRGMVRYGAYLKRKAEAVSRAAAVAEEGQGV